MDNLRPTEFGVFLAPFHPDDESPSLQIQRDLQLMEHLDGLGYDEAWIGEHHSAAFEIIGAPEVFIAAAVERTKRLRFGTGVSSLSYHHPLILADRMCQLDHQAMGRVMFGVGPGQLPTDAFMMGIDPIVQRQRMHDSLAVMLRLLDGEVVTEVKDWYELHDAQLQLLPYSSKGMPVAVASTISPSGATLAGRHGVGLLSVAASSKDGYDALVTNWEICEKTAADNGTTVSRDDWRVVIPMHIAETTEQAEADVEWGILKFVRYFGALGGRIPKWGTTSEDALKRWRGAGFGPLGSATIGSPQDAIDRIETLIEHTGGFGKFLLLGHNAASPEATLKSYDLFARYVIPHFQGANRGRLASLDWTRDNAVKFGTRVQQATDIAFEEHKQATQ
jgi:limonene 1,2-monooxygenase